MFGRRADGRRVKNLMIIEKAGPYFMPERIDGVNLYTQQILCKKMDEFILKERQESGVHFNYTEILIAAAVRMLYERPKANRFIVNCQIFQRNEITVSMAVKPKLTDDCDEVTLKFHFTGRENIYEIKKIVDDEIKKNTQPSSETHDTTKFAGVLDKMPYWLFKVAMKLIRFFDRYAISLPCINFSCNLPLILSMFAYKLSMSLYFSSKVIAVFSPTPKTPGILSELSPIKALSSII